MWNFIPACCFLLLLVYQGLHPNHFFPYACLFFSFSILFSVNGGLMFSNYDASLWGCIGGFFLGVFTYYVSKNSHLIFTPYWATILELLVVGLTVMLVVNYKLSFIVKFVAFIGLAVVIWLFSIQNIGLFSRLLMSKLLLFIGSLSYSIYMVHAIVFSVFGIVWQYVLKMPVITIQHDHGILKVFDTSYAHLINLLALLVVIGISFVTYHWVEVPWRNRFRCWSAKIDKHANLGFKK